MYCSSERRKRPVDDIDCFFITDIVSIGDRIAQLIVIKISTPKVIEVFELSKSERGERGFGSSGFNG